MTCSATSDSFMARSLHALTAPPAAMLHDTVPPAQRPGSPRWRGACSGPLCSAPPRRTMGPLPGRESRMTTTPVTLLERLRQTAGPDAWERFVELYTPMLYAWARKA